MGFGRGRIVTWLPVQQLTSESTRVGPAPKWWTEGFVGIESLHASDLGLRESRADTCKSDGDTDPGQCMCIDRRKPSRH